MLKKRHRWTFFFNGKRSGAILLYVLAILTILLIILNLFLFLANQSLTTRQQHIEQLQGQAYLFGAQALAESMLPNELPQKGESVKLYRSHIGEAELSADLKNEGVNQVSLLLKARTDIIDMATRCDYLTLLSPLALPNQSHIAAFMSDPKNDQPLKRWLFHKKNHDIVLLSKEDRLFLPNCTPRRLHVHVAKTTIAEAIKALDVVIFDGDVTIKRPLEAREVWFLGEIDFKEEGSVKADIIHLVQMPSEEYLDHLDGDLLEENDLVKKRQYYLLGTEKI